jgi:hypothetical protein
VIRVVSLSFKPSFLLASNKGRNFSSESVLVFSPSLPFPFATKQMLSLLCATMPFLQQMLDVTMRRDSHLATPLGGGALVYILEVRVEKRVRARR